MIDGDIYYTDAYRARIDEICEITKLVWCDDECGCHEGMPGHVFYRPVPGAPGYDEQPAWMDEWPIQVEFKLIEPWLVKHGKLAAQAVGGK